MGDGFAFLGCTWFDEKGDRFYTETCPRCHAQTTIPLDNDETHDEAKMAIKLGHAVGCQEEPEN